MVRSSPIQRAFVIVTRRILPCDILSLTLSTGFDSCLFIRPQPASPTPVLQGRWAHLPVTREPGHSSVGDPSPSLAMVTHFLSSHPRREFSRAGAASFLLFVAACWGQCLARRNDPDVGGASSPRLALRALSHVVLTFVRRGQLYLHLTIQTPRLRELKSLAKVARQG